MANRWSDRGIFARGLGENCELVAEREWKRGDQTDMHTAERVGRPSEEGTRRR